MKHNEKRRSLTKKYRYRYGWPFWVLAAVKAAEFK